MRLLALLTLLVVIVAVATTSARGGGGGLSARQVAFWDRVAQCEEHGQWWQRGGSYVGGLGIWSGNWYAWRGHVGVRTEASSTSRLDQMRVAQWGYENARAWWGCFSRVGMPVVD